MKLIKNKEQLIKNIDTLEGYLTEGDEFEINEATSLVKHGTCFVAYQVDKELRFAPSRFIGYVNNKLEIHSVSHKMDEKQIKQLLAS